MPRTIDHHAEALDPALQECRIAGYGVELALEKRHASAAGHSYAAISRAVGLGQERVGQLVRDHQPPPACPHTGWGSLELTHETPCLPPAGGFEDASGRPVCGWGGSQYPRAAGRLVRAGQSPDASQRREGGADWGGSRCNARTSIRSTIPTGGGGAAFAAAAARDR